MPTHSDAKLLALGVRFDALSHELAELPEVVEEDDENKLDAIVEKLNAVAEQILATRAATTTGMKVKAKLVRYAGRVASRRCALPYRAGPRLRSAPHLRRCRTQQAGHRRCF